MTESMQYSDILRFIQELVQLRNKLMSPQATERDRMTYKLLQKTVEAYEKLKNDDNEIMAPIIHNAQREVLRMPYLFDRQIEKKEEEPKIQNIQNIQDLYKDEEQVLSDDEEVRQTHIISCDFLQKLYESKKYSATRIKQLD